MHEGFDTGMAGGVPIGALLLDMGEFFKAARPVTEGDDRYVFIEPSIPSWDQEKELILKSALLGSRDHFLEKGNLDIEHLTALGHRLKIANPYEWEVGTPVEVRDTPGGIFVKGRIAHDQGGKADWFWHTLTERQPAMKWYPSVYGAPTADGARKVFHAPSREHRTVITKAIWRGIGFAKEPMNLAVPAVATVPFGAFVKSVTAALALPSCDGVGCDCALVKAVTTGVGTPAGGTDMALRSGGGALATQSIDSRVADTSWEAKATRYARSVGRPDACTHGRSHDTAFERDTMQDHFEQCEGMPSHEAARVTNHVRQQLRDRLKAA